MKKFTLFLLLSLALAVPAFPLALGLQLDPALRDADLVARVKIISVAKAPADSGFRELARATITDVAKGPKTGENIELLSDNGFTCPNVFYQVGDDCIVFAKRRKSGHYETMNTYSGQFRLNNDVTECYLLSDLEPVNLRPTSEELVARIHRKYRSDEIMAECRRRLSGMKK